MSARSLLLCLAVVAATVGGCGGDNGADVPEGAPAEASDFAEEWPTPNGDLKNRRVAESSEISFYKRNGAGVLFALDAETGREK